MPHSSDYNAIITAAITVIEKEGFHHFSYNKVAKVTGKNIREIQDLFPDLNELIHKALQQSIHNGFVENLEECISNFQDNRSFLIALFDSILTGALYYPKITKSHFYTAFTLQKESTGLQELAHFNDRIWQVLAPSFKSSQKAKVKRRLEQATASILFVAIFPLYSPNIDTRLWAVDLARSIIE